MNVKFLHGLSTELSNVTIAEGQLLFTTDTGHIYFDESNSSRIDLYNADITKLTNKIGTDIAAAIANLKEEVTGTPEEGTLLEMIKGLETKLTGIETDLKGVDTKISTAIAEHMEEATEAFEAAGAASAVETKLTGQDTDEAGATTIKGALKLAQAAKTSADGKVSSVKQGNGIEVTGTTEPTVAVKLASGSALKFTDGALDVELEEGKDYSINIADSTEEGGLKRYTISQPNATGGKTSWTIDIPKDLVVKSGNVQTLGADSGRPAGAQEAGTYVVLTLNNDAEDKIYINATSLVDNYEVGRNATEVQLYLEGRTLTAGLVNGGVTEAKLAANAVTAGKIAANAVTSEKVNDGAITKAKLAKEVTDLLGDGLVWGTFAQANT